jgi:hypothetical protein
MHAHTYIYNAQEEVEMKFSRGGGGRMREGQESFDTCSRIPALLVGINVTTQAPSCNNTTSLRQQQH